MGPLFEQFIVPHIESDSYQSADDPTRALMLEQMIGRVRKAATQRAAREAPDRYHKTREGRRSKRMQRYLASRRNAFREMREREGASGG